MKVYDFILSRGILSDAHKQNLVNRGFNDKNLIRNKFFSGGSYLLKIEQELIQNFKASDLLKTGVCQKKKYLHISPILLEDRIIIPYIGKDENVYALRPHKLGLKDVPIEIYHEINTGKKIILTEGEFKAAAAQQLGFNAIALPGVGSFSDVHFPRLVKFLNEHKIQDISIMFDNEVKDDPGIPARYKKDIMKRYDTQYYAFYMAKKLYKENFNCFISWLPDGWRQDGKIDIDGALAQGKTYQDFYRIVQKSKIPKVFFEELPGEIQTVIQKKMAKKYFRGHIRQEFGKYVATRRRGKTEWDEVVSNFTIKIVATHETSEGVIRDIIFINEFGRSTPHFAISPESMGGADSFGTFCLGRGNYIWRGTREDLANIWELEFLSGDGRHIKEFDFLGGMGKEWLIGNISAKLVKENENKNEKFTMKMTRPDENGIFWSGKKGIKITPLSVTAGKMTISEGIPYFCLEEKFDKYEAQLKLIETIGEMEAKICLGWITALFFMEIVFKLYRCFPFLFVTGRRGSGKSTIAEWLMNFMGLENAGKMMTDTTAVAIQRYLAYYSCLPVFLDEYRNVKACMSKNGLLRNAYNRQSAGKGIKSNFGIREAKIRGTLLLSGEETPEDNALLTRCVVVVVSKQNREENHFNWFMRNRLGLSYQSYQIIAHWGELIPKFVKILRKAKEYFETQNVDDRTATHYAVIAAGYAVGYEEDKNFAKWLGYETQRVQYEQDQEQITTTFLEDLVAYKSLGKLDNLWDIRNDKVFLYFQGLYTLWAQEYRKTRGTEPFKSSAIRDYLRDESGFLETNIIHRINGQPRKCMSFLLANAPEAIQQLVHV